MELSVIIFLGLAVVTLIAIFLIIYFLLLRKKPEANSSNIANKEIGDIRSTSKDKPIFELEEQNIPSLPEIVDPKRVNIRYPLLPPYAYAHVYWDQESLELIYKIEEPELDEKEKEILKTLEKGIKELINLSYISSQDSKTVLLYLEKNIKVLLTELSIKISMKTFLKIMYYIYRDFVGMNELEPLMNDAFIEDIECNGINTPVYIVHRKYKNIRTSLLYEDIHKMAAFVEKIAQKCGQYISYADPLLDGALPDGSIDYEEPIIYKECGKIKVCKIGNFVDKYYKDKETNKPIKIKDIEVPSFDKEGLELKWRKLDYVYRHKNKEQLYAVKAEAGREIKLTGAHSIFVITKEGVVSKKVEEIKIGDYIVTPKNIPNEQIKILEIDLAKVILEKNLDFKIILKNIPKGIFEKKKEQIINIYKRIYKIPNQMYSEHRKKGILSLQAYNLLNEQEKRKILLSTTSPVKVPRIIRIDKNMARLLGYYIAEGWTKKSGSRYGVYFSIGSHEKDFLQDLIKLAKKCFNLNPQLDRSKENEIKVFYGGYLPWLIFENILEVKKGAKNKRIPEIILNSPTEIQKEFLKGWHIGDYSSTTSRKLAEDVQYLGLMLDKTIPFYFRKREGEIENRKIISKEYYSNFLARKETKFHEMIPIELFNPLNKTCRRLSSTSRISRDRLKRILSNKRYSYFEGLPNSVDKKLGIEWTKRGFVREIEGLRLLTKIGQDTMQEYNLIKKIYKTNLNFLKVKSIKRVKSTSEYVYDVSVPNCENFVAGFGGICCHNSRVQATYSNDVSSRGPTFCIVDGYLQLLNGEVKKIDEYFRECKERYGSKFEEKNEIVQLYNEKCCGVDPENLTQMDADIKSIIKLTPPEKLVKIKLADGSSIEVTENHKFHVVKESGLELVEASRLEEGMFVPVPSKVQVEGCLQKIEVKNLLKEFSYIHKICIATTPEIKNLIQNEIALCNDKNYRKQLSQEYNVNSAYFYEINHRGNSINIHVFNKLCEKNSVDVEKIKEFKVIVCEGGKKNKSKAINIPNEINEELAYLAGAIISDGHLSKDNIDISTYEEGFRIASSEALIKTFGRCQCYYNGNRIYLSNTFVPFFFNKIFEIPYGNKSGIVKIPRIIFKSTNDIISSFIRGLFDGDGTCKSSLSYKTKSEKLAEGLTYLLARLGIFTNVIKKEGMFRVAIPSIYITKYAELIGFNNKDKQAHLKVLLTKQHPVKSYIRHGRFPAKPILNLMQEMEVSKNKISKSLGVSYNRLLYYDSLSKPFAKQIIELLLKENAKKQKVLKIKELIELPQEYIKILEVKKLSNQQKKPVYDIEVSPCNFYIGGNKPLNLFDTVRKFTKEPWSPVQLINKGTVSAEILAYAWMCIEFEHSFMVIGGTGSGKTSLLNSLAFFIPPQSRVVSIEDTRELQLEHENWLPSVARAGVGLTNLVGQRYGEVSLFDLLRASFRQRPDYIIVGEIRGKEAYVLFQAFASGHPGCATMHAEDVSTMIRRLETNPINLSGSLVMTLSAVFVMEQTKVRGQGVRKCSSVDEIIDVKENFGGQVINNVSKWDASKMAFVFNSNSKVFKDTAVHYGYPIDRVISEFQYRVKLLKTLNERRIFGFKEVQKIIHEYYKSPKDVLRKFGIIK